MHANSSSGADKGDLTDWLILRFKQLISEGTLTPGYKLPSERELSLHFGVSRTSLRPVMKILKMMGVISQRVGDGTYLNGDASARSRRTDGVPFPFGRNILPGAGRNAPDGRTDACCQGG